MRKYEKVFVAERAVVALLSSTRDEKVDKNSDGGDSREQF